MKVSAKHGRLQLRLESTEVTLLQSLFAQLASVVSADENSDDPVLQRLFPAAYAEDDRAEADFRSLTHGSLRTERIERIALCTGELSRGREVDLSDPAAADRWIKAFNDLRLALGTRLGVAEDDYERGPEDEPWVIYHWLTAVQDSVVTALMR